MSARDIVQAAAGVGGTVAGWDIGTAVSNGSVSVAAQEIAPQGVFVSLDGLAMYVTGSSGDDINQYTLSTAFDVTTATYAQAQSISAQETFPAGLFFDDSGTRMYVVGRDSLNLHQYSLGTAWDVSTLTHVQTASLSAQSANPRGVAFSPDGTKAYVATSGAFVGVNQYSLSTAWDVSTLSFVAGYSVTAQVGVSGLPQGVFLRPDGTMMFVPSYFDLSVYSYTLSTAYDVTSAVYDQTLVVVTNPADLAFSTDGLSMYMVAYTTDSVYQYTLS